MEHSLSLVVQVISFAGRGLAAAVILLALIRAAWQLVKDQFAKDQFSIPNSWIRLALGRSLALSLEFLLAADILMTVLAPTWNDIGMLAAIAALRTALTFFLERELKTTPGKANALSADTNPRLS